MDEKDILREDNAEYTYQNAFKSREVTDKLGIKINKAIICCKSFHARQCYTYYEWAYPNTEIGIDRVLGELKRSGSQFKIYIMQQMN